MERILSSTAKEPQYRSGDLAGSVRAPDAAAGAQPLPLVFREPGGNEREARLHHPHPDLRGEDPLPRGRLVREGQLGEAIGEIAGPQIRRAGIPQEEYRAAGIRPQEGKKRLREKKRPAQVDGEDPVPFPAGNVAHRRPREDRRVVDKDVQASELPLDRLSEPGDPPRAQKGEGGRLPPDPPGGG